MVKKLNCMDAWYLNLGCGHSFTETVSSALREESIALQPFNSKLSIPFGIVFVNGQENYEQLISVLQIQLRYLGHRIIVLNASATPFGSPETLKIFNYGAEYFYENTVLRNYECIIEKIKRWRNIESIGQSQIVK